MANVNITGKLNASSLGADLKAAILDFCLPVGTIYGTDNVNLNTPTKMHNHFGGTWEQITDRVIYGVSSSSSTGNAGSNSVTLSYDNLPPHSHDRGDMNITGTIGVRANNNSSTGTGGAFYTSGDTGAGGRYNGDGSTNFRINFSAARQWTGNTSSVGKNNPDAVDVRGARYNSYVFRRTA